MRIVLLKTSLIITLFLTIFVFIPKLSFAQEQIASSSYELFYPVVAGKLPGDPFYFLKSLREQIVGLFIFDDYRKVDYYLVLSKKRLVEAEALISKQKNPKEISKSISSTVELFQKSLNLANKVDNQGRNAKDLYNALNSDGERELQFIKSFSDKTDTQSSVERFQKLLEEINQKLPR